MKTSIRQVGSMTTRHQLEFEQESVSYRRDGRSTFQSHYRVVHGAFTSTQRRSDPDERAGVDRSSRPDNSSMLRIARTHLYRDTVCALCEKTVALALDIPLNRVQARTRCSADAALARQIAMYLCHTIFSLLLTEIGLHFNRDRTTVSYACAMIEDRRDDPSFDAMITQLEGLLAEARNAVALGPSETDMDFGRQM